MSRLSFALVLVALGCVSKCQCLRIPKTETQPPKLESTKIINGVLADILEFPYVASLQYNGTFYGHDYDHFCCGSILSDEWIITSAQCGEARRPSQFHVRVGSSKYYENGAVYEVDRVLVHPKFNDISRDYDVALIKVSKKIAFNDRVQPIRLPRSDEIVADDTDFAIIGWGAYELLGKISDDLLKSRIAKISREECQSVYGEAISDRMLCVFTMGQGPCVGDSGSPAVFDNKIIGLASWSYGCAYEKPTVYAKISSVLSWIEDSIRTAAAFTAS